jgi:hypothetical protein
MLESSTPDPFSIVGAISCDESSKLRILFSGWMLFAGEDLRDHGRGRRRYWID